MYRFDDFDHAFVRDRTARFRGAVARRIDGSLTEDEFKPLRLQNGVYLQLHAYMLRVAIPYGTLSARQMRRLALIASTWDCGYGHFTTRQNVQFNWPKLKDVPDILDALAEVEMHAVQTSGNCVRNVTTDHFAGAAADEIEDPRPAAELLRQWSAGHPEFAFLPRKFKIAVTGAARDRAAVRLHDVGLIARRSAAGEIGYEVLVGGGMGRTPMLAKTIRAFLPKADLLAYVEAILRVYNLYGRRDNKYKARIKILVHEEGLEKIREEVEAEFAARKAAGDGATASPDRLAWIEAAFAPPELPEKPLGSERLEAAKAADPALARWVAANVAAHRRPGYAIATISLKPIGGPPGDASAEQMSLVADLADAFSAGEIRVSHEQNLVLPHVALDDLPEVFAQLCEAGLATPNLGQVTDIIACPGLDYCALATARSIPIAQQISQLFADGEKAREVGELKVKISGCVNACGHHHVGHIGVLGLEKGGVESYQITLGGDATESAALGRRLGPGLAYDEVAPAVERIVEAYLEKRLGPEERFLDAYRRLGPEPFRAAVFEPAPETV